MRRQRWQHNSTKLGPSYFLFALLLPLGFATMTAGAQTGAYSEAPQLTQLVEAGELPPVEERLPENPMVIEPHERIGQYGGTWRTAFVGGGDQVWVERTIGYEPLVRVNPEWTEIVPNVAESYEVNEDGTEYTFHLREGLKWSDGHPYTVDDIMFWYEDVFLNEELNPAQTGIFLDRELASVEKIDDTTVVFRFAEPNGLFLQNLAWGARDATTRHPRHFLEQFHAKYNPEGVDALAREAGFSSWVDLFGAMNNFATNREFPVLWGWRWVTAYEGGVTRAVAERNPYYWKVDPEGNQLPYLDRVVYDIFEDAEVLLLRVLNGEIDMQDRHIDLPANRAVLADNMERGDYRFFDVVHSNMNTMIFYLNLTHPDPSKREIFQNKDFRIGLSHAINRQELIDLIWLGQGEPWQAAPRPEAAFYNERLAKQYTEYDVDLANEHLDRAGYTERDAQGLRLGPDGQRISFIVEVTTGQEDHIDALELIQGYWRAVGIDMQFRDMDRSLATERRATGTVDVYTWGGDSGLQDALLNLTNYMPPPRIHWNSFAHAWSRWYVDASGPGAEEPPAAPKRQFELYRQLGATTDPDEQLALMEEILEIAADEFYLIGINLGGNRFGIVRNNFRNVPESMPGSGGPYINPGPTNPQQYFIDVGSN